MINLTKHDTYTAYRRNGDLVPQDSILENESRQAMWEDRVHDVRVALVRTGFLRKPTVDLTKKAAYRVHMLTGDARPLWSEGNTAYRNMLRRDLFAAVARALPASRYAKVEVAR